MIGVDDDVDGGLSITVNQLYGLYTQPCIHNNHQYK